jgi:UDP-2,3-diacylglucosamine pyrophosphatase LpxH
MNEINTIVFSDVHLGSPTSRAYVLLNTLKKYRFKKLIIAGDMFDDIHFQHLTSSHWELLEHIGKISRRGVEVIWLEGNHDFKFYHFMAKMIGIPAHNEYIWTVGQKRFIAIHGHQFDSFFVKDSLIGRVFASFYSSLQRTISSDIFDVFFNRISDRWMRISEQVAKNAIEFAEKKQCNVIICGHTHIVHKFTKNNIEYFNVGSWNNTPSYILKIKENGSADIEVVT